MKKFATAALGLMLATGLVGYLLTRLREGGVV